MQEVTNTTKDQELWDQLRAGEKNALEKIYRDQAKLLLKYGSRFSPNSSTVEDCIQDLFIELWRNRERLGPTNSISSYLLASLRRKIIRRLKKDRRWVYSEDGENYQFDLELAIEDKIVAGEMQAENLARLRSAFGQLSKRQQEVIYLKYQAGLEYEDICEIMEINYQSVRNLVSNALRKMKKNVSSSLIIFFLQNFLHFY